MGNRFYKKNGIIFFVFFWVAVNLGAISIDYKDISRWCLKYNPVLKARQKEIKKTLTQYEKSLKAYLPDINLNLSGRRSRNVYRELSSSQYGSLLTGTSTRKFYQNLWNYNLSLRGNLFDKHLSLLIKRYSLLFTMSRASLEKTEEEDMDEEEGISGGYDERH